MSKIFSTEEEIETSDTELNRDENISEVPDGTAPRLQVESAESTTTNAAEAPQMQRKDSLTVPTAEVDAVDGAVFTRSGRRGSVRASVRQMQLPGKYYNRTKCV